MDIIMYLIQFIQYQYQVIGQLLNFICRYIPLKQWSFDDSHSPKYQKFKVDQLPKIISYKQGWSWTDLIDYYEQRYHKLSNLYSVMVNAMYLKIAVVFPVMLLSSILCGTMVKSSLSFFAKYVSPASCHQPKADSPKHMY